MSVDKGLRLATMIAMLVMVLPMVAHADNLSLNIKDSSNADKFVVLDTGKVGMGSATGFNTLISGVLPDLHIVREDAVPRLVIRETRTVAGGGGILNLLHNNGTEAARLPALNGDILGRVTFGSLNSANNLTNGAGIFGLAAENFTDASAAGKLSFRTTSTGMNSPTERMVIDSLGNVGIGTSTTGTYKLSVTGDVYTTGLWISSDTKLKKNVKTIDSALDKVAKMNGVQYEFNRESFVERNLPQGKHFGVIAQELENVMPEAVKVDVDGTRSVAYTEIIPVLIEAIKAQQQQIAAQQQEIALLKQKIK